MTKDLPMSMHADGLETALAVLRVAEQAQTLLDKCDALHQETVGPLTVWTDGCVIGRVEMQDDFFVFVPNSQWFGGMVEDQGLEEKGNGDGV